MARTPRASAEPVLTKRQADIVTRIVRYQRKHGYPPTCRELAEAVGIKPPPLYVHLRNLQTMGYIRRIPGVARGLKVLRHPDGVL